MAAAKKAAAKKPTKKDEPVAPEAAVEENDMQGPLDALGEAIKAAREAGLVVKAIATCNTSERGTTVRY